MTLFARSPLAHTTELDGEAFLARRDRDTILRLNPTAAALWRALAEPTGRDELVALFAAAFPEVEAEHLARDIDGVLGELLTQGMVVVTDG